MKFTEIPYLRPEIDSFETEFRTLITEFREATTVDTKNAALDKIYAFRGEYDTMYQLANIKYTTNTADDAFQKEVDFYNKVNPTNEKMINEFYQALLDTEFKEELKAKWGSYIFDLARLKMTGFDPSIIEELKAQNNLGSEYIKLKGTAKIQFNGEELNLAGIGKYLVDEDRTVRKNAHEARWKFFESKGEEIDQIYDKLVNLRHAMAKKMGFDNFVKLGYIRLGRSDYDETMVANFRKQIVEHIVPLSRQLRKRQQARLGYEKLYDYDLGYQFTSGNPKPKGSPEEILAKGQKMYKELSPETNDFFNYMLDHELLDVINRPGKADMGYCWELTKYKHPFIFANFNGTSGDIDVLTHEAGHAFQYFSSRDYQITEYRWPSAESAEIHSMSMEYLTYPWMKGFFEDDAEKYFFAHINASLLFMPYGCAIDHFQHIVYQNPEMTPNERAAAWKEMEALYLPDWKYDNNLYLEAGRFWQRQGHLFEDPFYYIDYVLAGMCAIQFWQKNQKDSAQAWGDYLRLCKAGGTKPFLGLVKLAKLNSPFEDGVVKGIANDLKAYLEKIDDTKF